jgi:hypothetical protein
VLGEGKSSEIISWSSFMAAWTLVLYLSLGGCQLGYGGIRKRLVHRSTPWRIYLLMFNKTPSQNPSIAVEFDTYDR